MSHHRTLAFHTIGVWRRPPDFRVPSHFGFLHINENNIAVTFASQFSRMERVTEAFVKLLEDTDNIGSVLSVNKFGIKYWKMPDAKL